LVESWKITSIKPSIIKKEGRGGTKTGEKERLEAEQIVSEEGEPSRAKKTERKKTEQAISLFSMD